MIEESEAEVDPTRLELYVRSLAPTDLRERQEQVFEQLKMLEAEGRIAECEVIVCGESVSPSSVTAETAIGRRLLDRYDTANRWATTQNRELVGFEQRETESSIAGTTINGISFPRLLLIEYRKDTVEYVAPSKNGKETTNVLDRLETY